MERRRGREEAQEESRHDLAAGLELETPVRKGRRAGAALVIAAEDVAPARMAGHEISGFYGDLRRREDE